jgi:hypothetical protein
MTLADTTFVVVSTTSGPDGRYWSCVDAFDEDEAMTMAGKQLAAPSVAFRLPTQRTKRLARVVAEYLPSWLLAAVVLLFFLTFQFRRSGAGFVVLSWPGALGYALLFEVTLALLFLTYLAILDFACARVGARTLAARATIASDGTVVEGPAAQDVIDAFGPERVARTVSLVNRGFGAGLLLILLLGVLSR